MKFFLSMLALVAAGSVAAAGSGAPVEGSGAGPPLDLGSEGAPDVQNPPCADEFEVPAELPSSPVPCNPGTWANANDYPVDALRNEVEGVSRFELTVDSAGKTTRCRINGTSGHDSLDMTTCRLMMQRATFVPAHDESGRPVEGTWSSAVRWEIPEFNTSTDTAPPLPIYLVSSFIVEKDGAVTNCRIEKSEGGYPNDLCANGAYYYPFANEAGEPIRKRVRTMIRVVHEDLPQ